MINLEGNHFLVMELLGPNLNDLMKMCGGKFSLSTTVVLGLQIVNKLLFRSKEFSIYIQLELFVEI